MSKAPPPTDLLARYASTLQGIPSDTPEYFTTAYLFITRLPDPTPLKDKIIPLALKGLKKISSNLGASARISRLYEVAQLLGLSARLDTTPAHCIRVANALGRMASHPVYGGAPIASRHAILRKFQESAQDAHKAIEYRPYMQHLD